ncbi:MAG: hypothetical protein M1546_13870 [Chloroflexi bacterium]|nr:hypothetical protein [Chloroflexota bacterium]
MINHRPFLVAFLALCLVLLPACGTFEIEMERTVQSNANDAATMTALADENARLSTQVAALKTSALTPTPAVTSTPGPILGKVAYVQGGDIWVKPLPDGQPQRLTTDGRNDTPRWSPSGNWLLFRKDEQTWLMRNDGTDARRISLGTATWSPTTDRFACEPLDDPAGLAVMNPDGTERMTLVPSEIPGYGEGEVDQVTWSADGAWLLYRWNRTLPSVYQGLWKVSADGQTCLELYAYTTPDKGDIMLAGWSPTGSQVYFWQGDIKSASLMADGVPLYSVPADAPISADNPPQRFGSEATLIYPDFFAPAPPASSLGRRDGIALVVGAGRSTWAEKHLELGAVALTSPEVAAISPAWSPDGEQMAYAAMPDRGVDGNGGPDDPYELRQRHLWVLNTSGEPQPHQLTDDPAYRDERPLWSAGGSHVLFARVSAEGTSSLWLVPATGGAAQRVVDELTPAPGTVWLLRPYRLGHTLRLVAGAVTCSTHVY